MSEIRVWHQEESRGSLLSKNERLQTELEVSETQRRAAQAELERTQASVRFLEKEIELAGVRLNERPPVPSGWTIIATKPDSAHKWVPVPASDWSIKAARAAFDMGDVEIMSRRAMRGSPAFELLIYRRKRRANRLPFFGHHKG